MTALTVLRELAAPCTPWLSRLRYDPRTHNYADQRRNDGKTDRTVNHCLKRCIARELYRRLQTVGGRTYVLHLCLSAVVLVSRRSAP